MYWALAILVYAATAQNLTNEPVIGILTQPYGNDPLPAYIAASYVKYLESAGARVVPVFYDAPLANLTTLFFQINGLLFPGGGADLTTNNTFTIAARHLYDLAIAANNQGDYFPIWGTCLGFELISVLTGGPEVLVNGFNSENLPLALSFTPLAASSQIFSSYPAALVEVVQTQNVTMNNHVSGVVPESFTTNAELASFYNLLSTNVDRDGNPFASTIEGKNYPVFGSQWHPEKNQFEFTPSENIPHTAQAIMVGWYTANFFVDKARQSQHVFPPNLLQEQIIYNYAANFTGAQGSDFEQCYFFNE